MAEIDEPNDCPAKEKCACDNCRIRQVYRAIHNGKGKCCVCKETTARDDLTLCFNTREQSGTPFLKVVCLACRKDLSEWQAWSHKVPV